MKDDTRVDRFDQAIDVVEAADVDLMITSSGRRDTVSGDIDVGDNDVAIRVATEQTFDQVTAYESTATGNENYPHVMHGSVYHCVDGRCSEDSQDLSLDFLGHQRYISMPSHRLGEVRGGNFFDQSNGPILPPKQRPSLPTPAIVHIISPAPSPRGLLFGGDIGLRAGRR